MRQFLWIIFIGLTILGCGLFFGVGCSSDSKPTEPDGILASDPFPANDSADVSLLTMLSWSYPDYDPDSVTFDIYFGTDNPPSLVASGITDTIYDPGPLGIDKTYYWKVVAHSTGAKSISSPVWSFGTDDTFTFPFKIGNSWDYQRSYFVSRIEPDTINAPYESSSGHGRTVILRSGYLHDTLEVYCFHVYWMEEKGGWEINRYLNDLPDGLYSYAYEPYHWIAPPKKSLPDGSYIDFHGMRFESVSELLAAFHNNFDSPQSKMLDSLVYEEYPVRELAYPLEVGNSWIYRDSVFGGPWYMDKAVTGIETVTVPAGTFECFELQYFWDLDGDGQYDNDIEGYDYTSPIGGVKRHFRLINIPLRNYNNDIIGEFDVEEIYELTGYDLK